METYFDIIPVELTRLILVKVSLWSVPLNLLEENIFSDILKSNDFWRDLFNASEFKHYVYQGLFNKDILYLVKAVPEVVNFYKRYTPDEMFDIYNFEYTNISECYTYLNSLLKSRDEFTLTVTMDHITDITVLQDNVYINIPHDQITILKEVTPFDLPISTVEILNANTSQFELVLIKVKTFYRVHIIGYRVANSYIRIFELKHKSESFMNIFMHILYHRPQTSIYLT